MAKFGRNFSSIDEFQERLTNFVKVNAHVKETNAKNLSWTAGHNKFSDWFDEEKKVLRGTWPSEKQDLSSTKIFDTNNLPESINWV